MRTVRCRKCGAPVVKISLGDGRKAVCDAEERLYWLEHPSRTVVTPNGEEIFASLNGRLRDAHGLGRPVHQCAKAGKEYDEDEMSGRVFVLLYTENSDNRCGADVFVFADLWKAQEKMTELYKASIETLAHDEAVTRDDYYCSSEEMSAGIVEGYSSFCWTIEEQEIR